MNTDEMLKGMNACRDGEECPLGASKDFERGYNIIVVDQANKDNLSTYGRIPK